MGATVLAGMDERAKSNVPATCQAIRKQRSQLPEAGVDPVWATDVEATLGQ
jgi:hypothetical protein